MSEAQEIYGFILSTIREVESKGENDYTKPYLHALWYLRDYIEEQYDVE